MIRLTFSIKNFPWKFSSNQETTVNTSCSQGTIDLCFQILDNILLLDYDPHQTKLFYESGSEMRKFNLIFFQEQTLTDSRCACIFDEIHLKSQISKHVVQPENIYFIILYVIHYWWKNSILCLKFIYRNIFHSSTPNLSNIYGQLKRWSIKGIILLIILIYL